MGRNALHEGDVHRDKVFGERWGRSNWIDFTDLREEQKVVQFLWLVAIIFFLFSFIFIFEARPNQTIDRNPIA
jgi:hypothetical protein